MKTKFITTVITIEVPFDMEEVNVNGTIEETINKNTNFHVADFGDYKEDHD